MLVCKGIAYHDLILDYPPGGISCLPALKGKMTAKMALRRAVSCFCPQNLGSSPRLELLSTKN